MRGIWQHSRLPMPRRAPAPRGEREDSPLRRLWIWSFCAGAGRPPAREYPGICFPPGARRAECGARGAGGGSPAPPPPPRPQGPSPRAAAPPRPRSVDAPRESCCDGRSSSGRPRTAPLGLDPGARGGSASEGPWRNFKSALRSVGAFSCRPMSRAKAEMGSQKLVCGTFHVQL
jgi:hypothetical protein